MSHAQSARLSDLLDVVRREFEAVAGDAMVYKDQRDDLEGKSTFLSRSRRACRQGRCSSRLPRSAPASPRLSLVAQQIQETNLMRQSLYELEARHNKIRQEFVLSLSARSCFRILPTSPPTRSSSLCAYVVSSL